MAPHSHPGRQATRKKPANILYAVDERPPFGVTLLSGLQHAGMMSIFLLFPLILAREASFPAARILDLLSASMLAMGVGAVLQAVAWGALGSGYLCPPVFTVAYLAPSVAALKAGGPPLLFGMTLFAGVVEASLSRLQHHLRPFFPPEVAGFVVAMLGMTIGGFGLRFILGVNATHPAGAREMAIALLSLATMLALSVWAKGPLRIFCALIGMAVGYAAAASEGLLTMADWQELHGAPLLAFPGHGHPGWSFDPHLILPFTVGALASCLKVIGNVTTCQKINDTEWTRPEMRSIAGGILADGAGTVAAGIAGTLGMNSGSSSVGLSQATGVTSRSVAYAIAGTYTLLAFLPKVGAVLAIMPRPVIGATVLFSACFVFISGLQIITSRMLDARRTFVVGLGFLGGVAADLFPSFFSRVPAWAYPFVSSSLVLGTLVALLLNLIFRLGIRRTERLQLDPERFDPVLVEDFMEAHGAAWGARRDVIDRASFNLQQSIETIVEGCNPQGPVEVEASFDEFNLDLRVSYDGPPLELPDRRPTNEEIMASEEGQRRLAGFMVRRHADRVQSSHKTGRSTLLFHFDH